METAITNLRAAGVVVVVSAGNDGSACNTINGPPAHFDGSYTIGSTTSSDGISSFSSRGNINIDGSGRIKPNVCAPGSSIRSCIRNGTYSTLSGTSMAGPHVAGAVALLISAVPALAGQVDTIESILEKTAVKITSTQTCNGTAPSTYPNNTVGHGRINILAAVNYALTTTAVSEQNLYGKGVTVFPTPATDKLYFRFENFRDIQAEVKLMNTTGQVVFEQKEFTKNNTLEISINPLPKGFYVYSITTNGISYHGKFIKE
jgi:serine protease AprX